MSTLLAMALAGVLGFASLMQSNPAHAQTRHVKHRPVRTTMYPYQRPYADLPPPGYTIGGPNYTACDRMNHDRMLVGRRC